MAMRRRDKTILATAFALALALTAYLVWAGLRVMYDNSVDYEYSEELYNTLLALAADGFRVDRVCAQKALDVSLIDEAEILYRRHGIAWACRIEDWTSSNITFWIIDGGKDHLLGTDDDISNLWSMAEFGYAHGLYHTTVPGPIASPAAWPSRGMDRVPATQTNQTPLTDRTQLP